MARTLRDQEDRRAHPVEHDLPLPAWSLNKFAEFLVAKAWSVDISRAWRQAQGSGPAARRRRRPTYTRPRRVRNLFAADDLGKDRLYGHVKTTKNRTTSLEFCRYLHSLYPAEVRMAIVCDNFAEHTRNRSGCSPRADNTSGGRPVNSLAAAISSIAVSSRRRRACLVSTCS